MWVTVGVSYHADMALVRATLEKAAASLSIRSLARDPLVPLIEFNGSSVDWEVSIWVEDPWNLRPSASVLREAVWQPFTASGVRMAFPQMDVHLDAPVVEALGRRAA